MDAPAQTLFRLQDYDLQAIIERLGDAGFLERVEVNGKKCSRINPEGRCALTILMGLDSDFGIFVAKAVENDLVLPPDKRKHPLPC